MTPAMQLAIPLTQIVMFIFGFWLGRKIERVYPPPKQAKRRYLCNGNVCGAHDCPGLRAVFEDSVD